MAPHDDEADVCGIVLYALFFLLVCARVRPFFVDGGLALSSTDGIKLTFHLCLLGSSLLEIVHYAIEIAFRGSVLTGYACHLVALWLSLVAFSLVIVLWSNTLNPPRPATEAAVASTRESRGMCCGKSRISPAAKFVFAVDAVVAMSTVVVLWTGSVPAYSRPYLILMVTHSVTSFLLASWLVLYGVRLQRRVMGHPRWEPLDRRQRLRILCRINGVLVVCAACFLVRVAVLSSALFVRSRHRAEEMNRLLFELLARWVSGLIPGVALLHIMCKTKRPADERAAEQMRLNAVSDNQALDEPLLPTRAGRTDGGTRRHPEAGHIGMMGNNNNNNKADSRGPWKASTSTGADNVVGGGGGGVGARPTNDSFVYHVVRSQRERTETTI